MSECILRAENIVKNYGKQNVLKNVSLEISEGEMTAITGQSGSGKSTLLYVLSGLDKPTSGDVYYKNNSLFKMHDNEISKLHKSDFGFIFQFYNLIDNFSVKDNITFPLIINGKKKNEVESVIEKYIDIVNLKDKLNKFPYQLSGGEQQRVAILRALVMSPSIIFADEPTGNLDTKMGVEIMELLSNIHKEYKTTVLMVTHNNDLLKYFSREIKIVDGKLY